MREPDCYRDGTELVVRRVLDAVAIAVIVTDSAGVVTEWNRAAEEMFGWSTAEARGRPIPELTVPPSDLADAEAIMAAIVSGCEWSGEFECRRKDGSRIWVWTTLTPLLEGGRVVGVVGSSVDVSERNQALEDLRSTEARFRVLFEHANDIGFVSGADGAVAYATPSLLDVLGYTADSVVGRPSWEVFALEGTEPPLGEVTERLAEPDARVDFTALIHAADGSPRCVEITARNLLHHESVRGIVTNVRDVTDRMEALSALRASEARQRAIVARSNEVTMFFEADGTIAWVSPAADDVFDGSQDALVGTNGMDLIHPEDRERVAAEFLTMHALGDHVRCEFRLIDGSGQLWWIDEVVTNLLDDPDVGYIVGNLRDITERKNSERELSRLALHDSLTGLANRALFVDRLTRGVSHGSELPVAVLSLDLDNFTDINDSFGHASGDDVLVAIASRLAAAARPGDTVARFGSDEFVVLCEDIAGESEAVTIAEGILAAVRAPLRVGAGEEVVVTASIGVALCPPTDPAEVLRCADTARFRAKERGRARITLFEEQPDRAAHQRLQTQAELHRAIESDEIVVWYQPIVDLHRRRVVSVEALARWEHPERGLLGADEFIPVAEATGFVREIGARILANACRDAEAWKRAGRVMQLSVNLAAAQLADEGLAEKVRDVLRDHALAPDALTLEITESAAMRDWDTSERQLRGLDELGVHLALDDFGTGYSSLSLLRRIPIDAVKIDGSFVAGLGLNRDDTLIVGAVISMARAMGHVVVAEGIETEAQREEVSRLGCRYGQGYLFSRPVPLDALDAAIESIESDVDGLRRSAGEVTIGATYRAMRD